MNQAFAQDITQGLSSDPKYLPSKYFYDEQGSKLFQQIMELDEYYPTRCEFKILTDYKEEILKAFSPDGKAFELIEFGAGDGLKTKILLRHFIQQKAAFKYLPIDISSGALDGLVADLSQQLPDLKVECICDDYFHALQKLKLNTSIRKVVLFMGANIGNFTHPQAIDFLSNIQKNLNPNDLLMVGFDLKKDPHIVLAAYNDQRGITREFNLNLLRRINKEFGANFKIENFIHYPVYDPASGSAKSYLMSTIKQSVHIEALSQSFDFEAWEAIHTEHSYKYTPWRIEQMAKRSGFQLCQNFSDDQMYFTDSIWKVI